MQLPNHTKLLTASLCAVTMWMGASVVATTVSADTNDVATSTPKTETEPSEPSSSTYVVKAGDYLEAIADSHEINWPSIYEINEQISNPDLIFPSQELKIPSKDVPLTRSIAGVTLTVSEKYTPQPTSPTQATPQPAKSPTSLGSAGVVGLGQVLGRPYVHGGTSLAGFDCSGLTQYMAALRGISLPRTVASQYQATTRIGISDLQPGDLVFFNWNHVGMYIGGNQIVHAANPSLGVRIDNLQVAIQYNGYLGAGALGR